MTPTLPRAARTVPAALLAVLALSACSFSGSVSAATSSAHGTPGSAGSTGGVAAAGTSSAGTSSAVPPAGSPAGAGSRAPAAAPSSPAGTSTAPLDRCHTGELAGSLTPAGAGAGQRYATLLLRNTGDRSCTVHGFGGLGLAGADGRALPTHQVRSGGPVSTVLLAPGGTAGSALHWSAVNGPGDPSSGACQPSPATLRVIPPDETAALSVPWTMGPVCSAGTIEQHPYAA